MAFLGWKQTGVVLALVAAIRLWPTFIYISHAVLREAYLAPGVIHVS